MCARHSRGRQKHDRLILLWFAGVFAARRRPQELEEALERQDEGATQAVIPVMLDPIFDTGRDPPDWLPADKEHVYLIDSVRSIDEADLFTMLQSVFLSYGQPDHDFAERLRNELTENGVSTWFFPRDAEPGARLHRHVQVQINSYDRMILCCSEASLQREGVLHEIEEVLEREQDEGGTEVLIPIMLEDVFATGRALPGWWPKSKEHVYVSLRRRVAADFQGAMEDPNKWGEQLGRLLKALRKKPSGD